MSQQNTKDKNTLKLTSLADSAVPGQWKAKTKVTHSHWAETKTGDPPDTDKDSDSPDRDR